MVMIGVIATAICLPLALIIPWFPSKGSIQAGNVRTLYTVLLIATVPIFVLVETVVLFSVWKFRMRPGQEEMDGPPIHGNTRLEVVWTAVPAILIVSLCTYAYTVLRANEDTKKGWAVGPAEAGKPHALTLVPAAPLEVPAGSKLTFTIEGRGGDQRGGYRLSGGKPDGRSIVGCGETGRPAGRRAWRSALRRPRAAARGAGRAGGTAPATAWAVAWAGHVAAGNNPAGKERNKRHKGTLIHVSGTR